VNWSAAGAIGLALAVAAGAFGAHALRSRLDEYATGIWEKAAFYHFIHALGLLVVPLFARTGILTESRSAIICWLLVIGILFFSGTLYLLALTGVRALGAVTPLGGSAFVAAWVFLAWALIQRG
jgi:uncharacterized membrane protein YgdD (TMEM256/DUF423 family)